MAMRFVFTVCLTLSLAQAKQLTLEINQVT